MLQRSWGRYRHSKYPEGLFKMTKRKQKVHAGSGLDPYLMFKVLTILDNGAGPNFVRRAELRDEIKKYIRHGSLPYICDANNRLLPMVGTVNLSVKLEAFLVHIKCTVCQSLAAPAILGADYFNGFVEAICPPKKLIKLNDGSTVPTARRSMKRPSASLPLPTEQEKYRTKWRTTISVKATETFSICPNCQKEKSASSRLSTLPVIHPEAEL